MYLGMEEDCSTGRFRLNARNADGNDVDLGARSVAAWVRDWPTPNMAEVQPDGSVLALKAIDPNLPESERWRIGQPVHVTFSVDSVETTAYLTITPWCPHITTYGPVRIYAPEQWDGIDYAAFLDYLHLPAILAFQYVTLKAVVGATPCEIAKPAVGRLEQHYVTACSGSPTPEVLEIVYVPSARAGHCEGLGMAGNPSTVGLNGLCPHNEDGEFLAYKPVMHEVGHGFLTMSKYYWQVMGGSTTPHPRPGGEWSESFANFGGLFAVRALERDLTVVGLFREAEPGKSLIQTWGSQRRKQLLSRLRDYELSNDTSETVRKSARTGMLVMLGDKYGWDMWQRFFRIFHLGPAQDRLWNTVGVLPDEVQFHTAIIAALSAAAGEDLRPQFEAWRFPIDNELYNRIIRNVEAIVKPAAPSNVNYDIGPNVPADQVEIITTGLQMAQEFLDSDLGGGIPEDVRNQITVKIVATGRGNEEPGGGGACCTSTRWISGVPTMRPFFDVAHPAWKSRTEIGTRDANNRKIAVHEYAHNWQERLGCLSGRSRPRVLDAWMIEGSAEFIAYEAMTEDGEWSREEVTELIIRRTRGLDSPLRDLPNRLASYVGLAAVHRLVQSAPNGILSLRTLCEEVAAGSTLPEAFETAFGVSLDDFYAAFEKHRENLKSPVKKPAPTPTRSTEAGQPESMPPNFKVAFIGDQGLNDSSREVLQLIKGEGADMVLHQGDFDYTDRPDAWDQQINQILGHDFPYFASIGNHDVSAWGNYQRKLQSRLDRISGARCTGDLGVNSFCTYRGLFFVLSGVGTLGSGHVSFIKEALASREAQEALWRICSWHKNQRLMQVGGKRDKVGWEPYEECRRGGAIIATGHEHSYSRTHLMDSFETQSIASTSTVHITRGNSFAFVSGLGGLSIRGQDDQLAAKAWWAAVHTSAQGADFGALFCTFNHKAVENRGHCYFKDLNGVIADEFEVIVAAAS